MATTSRRKHDKAHKTTGAYKLTHEVTGIVYFGSSKNVAVREVEHLRELKKNKHHNKILQEAFNSDPKIQFEVLAVTEDRETAYDVEQDYLHVNNSNPLLANVAIDARASQRGLPISEELREKLKAVNTGKILSDSTKEKIRIARTGKEYSESTKEKQRLALKGKPISEEHNRNSTIARTGLKRSGEALANIAAANAERSSVPITVDGVTYPSKAEAARQLGMTRSLFRRQYCG